jgi:hypothetical protein
VKNIFYASALLSLCALAEARPVSYAGGTTVMQNNDAMRHNLHVHYSPSVSYSVGVLSEYWHALDGNFNGVQANWLAKRWNQKHSQANLYVKTAFGQFNDDNHGDPAGFIAVSADWENRRYFAAINVRYSDFGNHQFDSQSIRLGVAPYVADYGSLHTWLMFQHDENTLLDKPQQTLLLRFFKGDYLAEIGTNQDGKPLLNAVIRY